MNINKMGCLIIRYYVNGYIIINIIFKKAERTIKIFKFDNMKNR